MARTWIFQSNPKLYDIDAALNERRVIYWRVPQFFEQLQAGDRVLIWRSGKQAGIVGSAVSLSDPRHYDLSADDDPHGKSAFPPNEWRVPLRVWPEQEVPKQEVAEAIPEHRIVTNPMGTVFPVDADHLAALMPLLETRGYDLNRTAEADIPLLPVAPELDVKEAEQKEKQHPQTQRATITPAMFLLSSTPDRPIEITIEGDSLRLSPLSEIRSKRLRKVGMPSASTCFSGSPSPKMPPSPSTSVRRRDYDRASGQVTR